MPNVPTARAIHEAAETAIYELLIDGKSEASFQGKQYTAISLDKLQSISDRYRAIAIQRGELSDGNLANQAVRVSHARVGC